MAVIYLRHPIHGSKVACSEMEAEHDRAHGWEDYDPAQPVNPVPGGLVVPDFLSGASTNQVVSDLPEDFPGRDDLIKAGYATWESVVDLDRDQLIAIKGIGPKTADAILEKMEG